MLLDSHKKSIQATVPLLRAHGLTLTKYFYQRMFEHHPELKNVFNQGNQQTDKQQMALAMAVLAYAENISNPGVLMPVVDLIGHKHSSLNIQAKDYAIVGEHLLASIGEVLGDLATEEVVEAWEKAYWALADIMIGHEEKMSAAKTASPHSWTGWKSMRVSKKQRESDEITSFYLVAEDGAALPAHLPGQYISVQLFLPELNLQQARQYSLSAASNGREFRISVKRETGRAANPDGKISNFLHDCVALGDVLRVSAPSGNFVLQENSRPKVFVSGGIGQTPLMAMLESLLSEATDPRPITWIHGCRSQSVQAFDAKVRAMDQSHSQLQSFVFYDQIEGEAADNVFQGPLDLSKLSEWKVDTQADYYLCGPGGFIEKHFLHLRACDVDRSQIFFEEFGPQSLQIN